MGMFDFSDWYTHTATVNRYYQSGDEYGNTELTSSGIDTASGRLEKINGDEQVYNDKEGWYATHTFFCEPISGLTEYDRLEIDSIEYRILDVDKEYDEKEEHHYEIYLEKYK